MGGLVAKSDLYQACYLRVDWTEKIRKFLPIPLRYKIQ